MSKRIVVVGATGMIGGIALRCCLEDDAVGSVVTIGRRETGVVHDKLTEVIHADFTDCSTLSEVLAGTDAALFCLGVYSGALPDAQFRTITVDCTLRFAEALYAASPSAAFCFLSGQGADQTETSRTPFARYKGIAENGLIKLGFHGLHIFRPGYIYPVTPRAEPNVGYRMMRAVWPMVRRLYPAGGIDSTDLGRAIAHAGIHGRQGPPVLENRDIQGLVAGL